ncbi:pentapeptide repeat-containing protein [Virgibacillus dokdonensis]|uniref:Pentapeptide repeat-containing protein n=1 Tax=Virgibacillus dokdonensis TaxID=302167 RepID=A0ABU7VLB4_9BACI
MKPKQRLIQKPDLPEELLIRSLNELTDNSFIEMAKYDHTSSSFTASHVGFEDVFFTNVNMSQSKFPFSSWTNVLFDTCDLSQLDFQGARFRRVEFRNCKLAGVNFSQTDMQDVRFIACEAPYTLFGNAILRDGELVDCLLKGSQFIDTKLDYVQLDNVVLDDVSFDFTF